MEEISASAVAEQAVLGICLLNQEDLLDAVSTLKESDFTTRQNQLIFHALSQIVDRHIPADPVIVCQILSDEKTLDQAGGSDYVKTLMLNVDDTSNYKDYVRIIREKSSLRQLSDTCQSIIDTIRRGGINDVPAFVAKSRAQVNEITEEQQVAGFRSVGGILEKVMGKFETEIERIKTIRDPRERALTGLSTGYPDLDYITGGFNPAELIIIGARPSVGKTTFAINLALNVARRGTPVAFFSLEMSDSEIVRKMLCNSSNMSADEIRDIGFVASTDQSGNRTLVLPPEKRGNPDSISKLKDLKTGMQSLRGLPIYIDDKPGTTVSAISAEVKSLSSRVPNLGLIVIDYLTQIHSADKRYNSQDSRSTIVGDISRALKQVARDYNIPVLTLSQFSRDPDKRSGHHEPVMSDLRDSGGIEQDADQIYLLYRPDYYETEANKDGTTDQTSVVDRDRENAISTAVVKIAKNRNGRTGSVNMIFDKPKSIFWQAQSDPIEIPNEEQETPL